jgi:quercetin dioxygenase-like cupin family protein
MGEPSGSQAFVAGPGVGTPLDLGAMQMLLKASTHETQGSLSLYETEDEPGLAPPPHIHTDTSEAFYVLEGEYEMTVDGQITTCGPGSLVFIPPGVEHGFVTGPRKARKLIIFVPGAMESYFAGMDAALRSGPVSADEQTAIARRANMIVVAR